MSTEAVDHFIKAVFEKVLLRPVDDADFARWQKILNDDISRSGDLMAALFQSPEYARIAKKALHQYIDPSHLPFFNDNSQYGEVKTLFGLMLEQSAKCKIAVDVGANGRELSNVYDLMRHFRWRGVLIEPNPYLRSRIVEQFAGCDFALIDSAVSDHEGTATLHLGVADGISSIHRSQTEHYGEVNEVVEVKMELLSTILKRCHVPKEFGLLSVDAEGEGHNVINEMFDAGFRPSWIIHEVGDETNYLKMGLSDEVRAAYSVQARTPPNLILQLNK